MESVSCSGDKERCYLRMLRAAHREEVSEQVGADNEGTLPDTNCQLTPTVMWPTESLYSLAEHVLPEDLSCCELLTDDDTTPDMSYSFMII